MKQYSSFERVKYNKRRRENSSRSGSFMRHRSQTPESRKRPWVSNSRSRSPEAYQNADLRNRIKDHIFDRSDDSPRRGHLEHWSKRRKFDRFDDSPNRIHVDSRREEHGRFDRSVDMPDRNLLLHKGERRIFPRFRDTPDRFDMKHRDKRRTINRTDDTPDRNPATNRDDRGIYDKFSDTPDRSPLSYRDGRETFDRYDEAQDHSLMENEGSEHSNSSHEYPIHRRSSRISFSPYSNEDVHSSINRYDPRGIPSERERFYENDGFNEYGTGREDLYASTFDRHRVGKNAQNTSIPLICKFYNNEGACKRGDSCEYLHVCKYFIYDDCKFGEECKRSHNVLDKQPRAILEKYDMIPDYTPSNCINTKEITDWVMVKDKLKNLKTKLQRDKTKSNFNRLISQHLPTTNRTFPFRESSYLNRLSDDEADRNERRNEEANSNSSKDMSSDNIPKHSQSSADFIPLESNVQTKIKKENVTKKKTKKVDKRSKKCRDNSPIRCKDDKEMESTQQCENITNVLNVPTNVPTITFESQNSCRKFQIRKANEQWQISNMCGVWVNLEEAHSESFCEMYNKAFEIGEKFIEMAQE